MSLCSQGLFTIGAVERDTGISRDTLRIWERRYGFLTPARNAKGERVYSAEFFFALFVTFVVISSS